MDVSRDFRSRLRRGAAGGLLALAAAAPAMGQEEIELTFAHFLVGRATETPTLDAAVDRFEAAHPNVAVNEDTSASSEYLQQFNVGAAAGALPDVFMLNGADVTGLSRAGLVADISGALAANPEWMNGFQEGMLSEFTRGDAIYGVPYGQIVNHTIYWNEDIFEAAGIDGFPETWDGLIEAVEKLKAHGVTPISLGNKARWVVASPLVSDLFFRSAGREWYERLLAREAEFTDPEIVAALERFKELVDVGAFNPDANSLDNQQQRSPYYRGEAAMFIEGSWAIPGIIEEALPEVRGATRIAHWPELPGGATPANSAGTGAGWAFAMNSALEGEEREAALDLLKALSDEEYGRARLEIGLLPAQVVSGAEEIEMDPLFAGLAEQLSTGELEILPIFTIPLPRAILDTLGVSMQDLMVGNKTPREVAEDLQREYERAE